MLDLSDEGDLRIINQAVDPATGKLSGTVEFLDSDGASVGWGHFNDVDEIMLPAADPDKGIDGLRDDELVVEVEAPEAHGEGKPDKIDLSQYLQETSVCESDDAPEDDTSEDDPMMHVA